MIFVILGIIILAVSFAVALVSLIREQKEGVSKQRGEPDLVTPKSIDQVEDAHPQHQPASADYKLSNLQEPSDYKFPWDGHSQDGQNVQDQQDETDYGKAEVKLGGGFSVRELAKKREENY